MTEPDSMAEALRRLVALVAENGLSELIVEEGGVTLTVKAEAAAPAAHPGAFAAPAPFVPAPSAPVAAASAPPAAAPKAQKGTPFGAPMVGVFYRSPSPDDPPFVNVGDVIRVGQTIGLIEAMKVYSEVPSEVAGRITEIPVDNGKLVQQGQPLLYVEPV